MNTKGIIISNVDYKETSKLVNIFTPNGKIVVKALGSKSIKNGLLGFITTGNIVSFIASDAKLPTIIEYNIEYSIYDEIKDIKSMNALSTIILLINELRDENIISNIYYFIEKVIKSFNKINMDKLISIFLIKMLYCYGITPQLKTCAICNKNTPKSFITKFGGGVCESCANFNDDNLIDIWNEYYYKKDDFNNFSDCDFNKLLKEIKSYYSYHLGININY